MIQRIQSVYLFLSALIMSLLFFFQIADFPGIWDFYIWKLTDGTTTIYTFPIAILASMSILISIITIFFYKNRAMQIKLCMLNFLFILILLILVFWIYPDFIFNNQFGDNPAVDYNVTIYLPIVSFIFILLANKAIRKDDKLIKSTDRLR
ncbi:MAG: DUF4293 domain-containing protein [Bacteroidota bacterium]